MFYKRLIELVALVMVGDGVVGFFKPRWHSLLWKVGPKPYRAVMVKAAPNPSTARWIYAAEVVVGTLIATHLTPTV